ncbi:MAG: PepSY domain-containing protein [Williamsia sp.]|nr:PepSY domain-containing protein [Williamsia sp.]
MAKSKHYYIRKTHRYLGVILGVQFLFWTLGGLYFSWSSIDEIHGDLQRKQTPKPDGSIQMVSPDSVLRHLPQRVDYINSLQLVNILQQPHYSITYFSQGKLSKLLADARTGMERQPVSKDEAVKIATESFKGTPTLKSVEYITTTNGHHEYREKPLPAWAITFDHPTNTTVYVSSEVGRVEAFRNNKWRLFDLLWMMHTMDYKERDNFNNWLLRAFALFGLLTILSGFVLYWVSRKRRRKRMPTLQTSTNHQTI